MGLSIADFIILLIVIIILIIYRQMDRNNRSLEKIRRYADKMTEELDKFVDGKTVDVKNLAVELEVHQKTGREILKRINTAEDELNARAEGTQRISQRIDEYDLAINNLLALTGKVDESMRRLQEESEFVDKTGKRLKDVQGRLEDLEKDIPRLTDKFREANRLEIEGLKEESLQEIRNQAAALEGEISRSADNLESQNARLDDMENRWEDMEKAALERIRREQNSLLEDAQTELANLKLSLDEGIGDSLQRIDAQRRNAEEEVARIEGQFKEKIRLYDSQVNSLNEGFERSLQEAIDKGRNLEDEIFEGLRDYIQNQARGVEKDITSFMAEEKNRLTASNDQIQIILGETQGKITEWQGDIEKRLEDEIDKLDRRFEDYSSETLEKLEGLITDTGRNLKDLEGETSLSLSGMEEKLAASIGGMETQIRNYEEEFAYRLSKMENIGAEVQRLDENLRTSMDSLLEEARADFAASREEMQGYVDSENAGFKARIQEMISSIGSLEKELDELKGRAYENVSEKLQVFEDEFFKDLKIRDETIRKEQEEWNVQMARTLEQLSESSSAQREALAKELGEQLKDRLAALQSKTFQQYEKYEEQVTNYQERINQRIGLTERSLEGLEDSLKKEIADIRTNSAAEFDKSFTAHRTSEETLLKKWEREWELAHKAQEEKMEAGFRNLGTEMDSAKSEITLWQNRVQQEMNESEIQVSEKLAQLKAEASETVLSINKSFVEQKNDFDAFFLDLQKRSKDLEIEIDAQIKDYRAAAGDMKDKVDAMQQRLFGKIEEDYNSLLLNVQEVDKRLKNFLTQTKIFDRADSLKTTLQENIEDLKAESARITSQVREIKEIERKFITIKKMDDEVSSKLARFLTEKRRIEEMEGDFKKLINLSQSIDIKLDQVTTSHDALQEIQIRIRSLEEMEAEVFQKYERLERKKDVIEATSAEVDKNFQKVQDLEESMRSVEVELRGISPQVADLAKQIKFITGEHKRTAAAITQLEKLDDLITETEDRMEKMQKAREWLAATETRLEEINKKAQEQVKLLGALVKDGKNPRAGAKASAMESREVVSKLAGQGWSVEEISRATQLSRGEVELILELKK